MLILSIDSAAAACGACLWRDGEILAIKSEAMDRGQDRRLIPLINEIMAKAETDFEELDRVAVTRGPGSFTGLRIGLAAARGIGLAAGKSVIGIDRFAIYREQQAAAGESLFIVIESKRQELFCRFYPSGAAPGEPHMLTRGQIAEFLAQWPDTITTGDAHYGVPPAECEAITCARLAARAALDEADFLPRPLYIREPDVTFPHKTGSGRDIQR
ncbi:MAG: tRNA (adenosine(37)-N6)-threonylcarbamoyltransferase complex dimerization subunit type 1 TsaB [Bdellovibrionales bacterium]